MQINEQPLISDYLDQNGVKEGDRIYLEPLSGRRVDFTLNRTCIDFISQDLTGTIESNFFKVLGSQKSESFHVQIRQEKVNGRNNVEKLRYLIQVLKGSPVKVNGIFVLGSLLEENDSIEIGFNRLKIHRNLPHLDFDPQKKMLNKNQKVVESMLPVLIEGETGVGKTSLAHKIHIESNRSGKFVHLNLASFSPNLLESELFGHVRGAFTGAVNDKKGAFREAEGGTLFIDEIDSLPMEIQTKLLLFLDDLKARPVGGAIDYTVNLRIIFSSGSKLEYLVQKERMRKDFFFRISSGQKFVLEPLRDNPLLVEQFCNLFMVQHNISITKNLVEFYQSLPWPGNYRQLKGHLQRKQILANSFKLDFDEVDELLIGQSSGLLEMKEVEEFSTLLEVKVAYAQKVYYQCGKNYTRAAQKLSISSRSLRNLMKMENYKTYEPTM